MTRAPDVPSVSSTSRTLSPGFSCILGDDSGLNARRSSKSLVVLGVSERLTNEGGQVNVTRSSSHVPIKHCFQDPDTRKPHDFKSELLKELRTYTTKIFPSPSEVLSWPKIATERWNYVNRHKSSDILAVISWNTNGRLDLRGCRENLLRRWVQKGFVNVALIQEHG